MAKSKTGKDIVLNVTTEMHERIRSVADSLDMPMGKFLLECAFGGMPEVTQKLVEIRRREMEKEQKLAEAYARQLGQVESLLAKTPEEDKPATETQA